MANGCHVGIRMTNYANGGIIWMPCSIRPIAFPHIGNVEDMEFFQSIVIFIPKKLVMNGTSKTKSIVPLFKT